MDKLNEAARQAAVLATCRGQPDLSMARLRTDAAGLRAYQLNAQATAQRVLASTYPTVAAMLGADTLDALALILWRQHPPSCGDLGEWGGALPALLASHADLQTWPWLADCARLDWAHHQCGRAADTVLDAPSLLKLDGSLDPAQLRLLLHPCVQVLNSDWPIGALWAAHQLPPDQQAQAATEALAHGCPQTVVVWRQPWQVQMLALPMAQADWMLALARSQPAAPTGASPAALAHTQAQATTAHNLAELLDQAPPDFDFGAWLGEALQWGWIWRVGGPEPVDKA